MWLLARHRWRVEGKVSVFSVCLLLFWLKKIETFPDFICYLE